MVLAQAKGDGKSNEITALPALLDIRGQTVRCIHNGRRYELWPMLAVLTFVLGRETRKRFMRM